MVDSALISTGTWRCLARSDHTDFSLPYKEAILTLFNVVYLPILTGYPDPVTISLVPYEKRSYSRSHRRMTYWHAGARIAVTT